ncbi:hypothetical protein J7I98_26815 [Streptomyces sp. ISL-98]|uniref:hypothetical protein n=1 Tax=Streptomyces sp. ISL-98 TaxID=2819192 RepID=UPI001BE5330E|nr:hypothetical protein [Streptomyces sp. ISL-98]MBT2509427.1 hypothetical protein [Streptomyces sp. ISL-98]
MDHRDQPLLDVPELRFRSPDDPAPPGEEIESPTLPLPPPRDRDELELLVRAVATTPTGERRLIIATIAEFGDRERVAALLHEALFELPVRDFGRHLMLLSLTGELRELSSVEPLERFLWLDDGELLATPVTGPGCVFSAAGALQARAAEMFVWVLQGAGSHAIRRILTDHPTQQVRMATLDACAYAADDDPGELDRLRALAREEDQWAVSLPRRAADPDTGGFDAEAFDRAVERQQAEFGSVVDLPGHLDRPKGDGDVS